MISFKRILCPVDLSDTSARALRYAAAIATWYESQLTVLHVASTFDDPQAGDELPRAPYPGSRDEIMASLRRAVEQADAGAIAARLEVHAGRPPKAIVEAAAAIDADLLVMGTHGAYALELGRQAGGRVKVLYSLESMDPEEALEPSVSDPCRAAALEHRRRRQAQIDRARDQLHAGLAGVDRTWCDIEEIVAINRAYKEILLQADAWYADLVVMGAQGSGGVELMLYGSNTHHVVRGATCPVLTVRA